MHVFQKLTPIKSADLKIYNDALNYVFANDDIKNVAVSGAYSAGKSSVIETYKSAHPELHFLHISLAHFESIESGNDELKHNEALLEGKVLNQLIHQIPSSKIPRTNFKVKRKVSARIILKNTAIVTSFFISLAYIREFGKWSTIISTLHIKWLKNILMWTTNSASLFLAGLLCAIVFILATYGVVKTGTNKNILKRVKLQGTEIEVFEQNEGSYFDKHLNEVLYLFENADADIIVFEDMDRYNTNQIFEKLKEINTLINRPIKKRKTPIRFFYLLRDDIFLSKDRTKFFDFIMPIVPVIDGSNSYDQFIGHFKQGGISELFDESFLQRLSLYVDDMRLLKNTYNEFVIYRDRIQSIELNNDKLLALITYKNIFPRDFSELQLGKGFVYTLFEKKSNLIEKQLQTIDNKIRDIEAIISQVNGELIDNLDELDALYCFLNRQLQVIGRQEVHFRNRAEFIRAMKDNPSQVRVINPYNQWVHFDIQDELNKLPQNQEYVQRRETVKMKSEHYIETLKSNIVKLQNQKSVIRNSRMRDIISKENIDDIFSISFKNEIGQENIFEEVKASPYFDLIKYLVRNGYIDETYPDYMTYFYENSLSRVDKIFLRSVTDQVPKEYTYSLMNPQRVLSRLELHDFDHQEVLNFDLLCHLLETQSSNSVYLNRLLQQLMHTKSYKFIGGFLDINPQSALFVKAINHLWPSVFQCILTESDFSYEQKKQYAIYTLYYSSDADIEAMNEDNCLETFISDSSSFLEIYEPNVEKLIQGFSLIGVRFAWIKSQFSDKELFSAVYKSNQYELTFDLIALMLEEIYTLPPSRDFNNKNYTLIISQPDAALVAYVKENINHYVGVVLDNSGQRITDEEFAVLELLNNPELDFDKKEAYINYLQTRIDNITAVEDRDLWSLLLRKNVKYCEENILQYFFGVEGGLDSSLIRFINSETTELNFQPDAIKSEFGDDSVSQFFSAIVICNELHNGRYETILRSLNMHYKQFPFEGIEGDKILVLISLRIIRMNAIDLSFVRENYLAHRISFILKNISEYVNEVINEENFDLNEMLQLLEEDIDDQHKIKLLELFSDELSLRGKTYSDAVKLHILNHNLHANDIPFLLDNYPTESVVIKAAIRRITTEHIVDIIRGQYFVPLPLLSELFSSQQLDGNTKKDLFAVSLPSLNKAQTIHYLRALRMDDFLSLFERKRPKFDANSVNRQILSIFQDKGWITRFQVDKEEPAYYRAFGRNLHPVSLSWLP